MAKVLFALVFLAVGTPLAWHGVRAYRRYRRKQQAFLRAVHGLRTFEDEARRMMEHLTALQVTANVAVAAREGRITLPEGTPTDITGLYALLTAPDKEASHATAH